MIGNLQQILAIQCLGQFYKNVPIFRFESYVFEKGLWPPNPSYEQTNIFLMSCAAATIGAIVFSKGAPYRKPLYTNGIQFLKVIYSEKATKFCEIFPLLLTVCTVVKSKGPSQNI